MDFVKLVLSLDLSTYFTLIWISWFVFLTILVLGVRAIFRRLGAGKSKAGRFFINLALSVFSLFYFLLIVDIFYYFFLVKSDSFNFTLNSTRWFVKYWHPINSSGFRDIERPSSSLNGRKTLFVIGDSIVAGHGIKNIQDRFSDQLQEKLGRDWVVVNLGKNGLDSSMEYNILTSYPHRPDRVILSYFINDIQRAAYENNLPIPKTVSNKVPEPYNILVNNSFFLNYLYWWFYRVNNKNIGDIYWNYLKTSFSSNRIWQFHKKELLRFVNYAKEKKIDLSVVVFPNLRYIKGSRKFTSKVVGLMRENNIKVIDLAAILEGRDPDELTVNKLDYHPSVKLHHELAEILFTQIRSSK